MVHGLDLSLREERGGVEDVVPHAVDEADDGDDAQRLRGQTPEGAQVVLDEGGPEDQVLRRVAGHRQLGQRDQVRRLPPGAFDRLLDQQAVALEVPHRRVDLRQCHPYARHGGSGYLRRPPEGPLSGRLRPPPICWYAWPIWEAGLRL